MSLFDALFERINHSPATEKIEEYEIPIFTCSSLPKTTDLKRRQRENYLRKTYCYPKNTK